MKFNDFNFSEEILSGVSEAGFTECMPVQEQTFTAIFEGRDILAQSQTGTGKTAAFLLSSFHLLLGEKKGKKALFIAPTRELAVQIEKDAKLLGKNLELKTACFYGGVGYVEQRKKLAEGVDLLIGTPGRLLDLADSREIDMKEIAILVIDEADRLFDMGFIPDLKKLLKKMVPTDQRKTMLFSATMSSRVQQISWEYLTNPKEISIEPEQVTVDRIKQELYHVGKTEKFSLFLGLLKKEKPTTTLVFTNTKSEAERIVKRLKYNGYNSQYLSGDLPQAKRLRVIEDMKAGKIPLLVATDVAARGLHIDDLSLVINYDIPEDPENYVHRIGRTARAGHEGKAISLACEKFVYGLPQVEDYIDMKIPVSWADESMFSEDKSVGMNLHNADRNRGRKEYKKPSSSSPRGNKSSSSSSPRVNKSSSPSKVNSSSTSSRTNKPNSQARKGGYSSGKEAPFRESRKKSVPNEKKKILDENGQRLKSQIDNLTKANFDINENVPVVKKSQEKRKNQERGKNHERKKNTDYRSNSRNKEKGKSYAKKSGERKNSPVSDSNRRNRGNHSSLDERLEYYKQKYGEDFVAKETVSDKKSKPVQAKTKKKETLLTSKKPEKTGKKKKKSAFSKMMDKLKGKS